MASFFTHGCIRRLKMLLSCVRKLFAKMRNRAWGIFKNLVLDETMKKLILSFLLFGFVHGTTNAQIDTASKPASIIDSARTNPDFVVELNDGSVITGKKVSDDGREMGIMTQDKGLILIPKFQIKSIELAASLPTVGGKRVFPNPHPGRYYYSPSGLPMKKGEGYVQAIYFLAYQAQYALSDHISVGASTSLIASPFLVNVKYTNTLKESVDGKNNIYFASGIQAGSLTYISPGTWLGIGYAGLTFGNAESNVSINGGVLGVSAKTWWTNGRENDARPAVSLCWNKRFSPTASFMGEVWYAGNMLVGGPGMRFYSGRKSAVDVAILGAYNTAESEGVFGIPFVSWTRKIGDK